MAHPDWTQWVNSGAKFQTSSLGFQSSGSQPLHRTLRHQVVTRWACFLSTETASCNPILRSLRQACKHEFFLLNMGNDRNKWGQQARISCPNTFTCFPRFSLEKCRQSKGNHCTSSKTKAHRCQLAEWTHSDCSRNLGGGGMLRSTGCICMDMELPCGHVYIFKAEVTNNIILTY